MTFRLIARQFGQEFADAVADNLERDMRMAAKAKKGNNILCYLTAHGVLEVHRTSSAPVQQPDVPLLSPTASEPDTGVVDSFLDMINSGKLDQFTREQSTHGEETNDSEWQ